MPAEPISIVHICNIALSLIGEPIISSLADANKAARLCDLRYNDVKRAVLRAHPWNCAVTRADLAQEDVTPPFGFANSFVLPVDLLRLLKLSCSSVHYRIEGRSLLTDEASVGISYIRDMDDPTQMDELLRQAIAARMAAELCLPLARSSDRQKILWEQYEKKLSEARFVDAMEHPSETLTTDEWMNSRFGYDSEPYRGISP